MPKVTVQKSTQLSPKDSFEKIKVFLDNDPDLRKLDSSYKCQFDPNGLTGSAKGSKFQAALKVTNQAAGSQVEIIVDLPLLLTPFKGMVESTLQKKLDRLLG